MSLLVNGVEMPEPDHLYCDGWFHSDEQIQAYGAAVRLQALEDAMSAYSPDDLASDWMDKIRALKGTP